MLKEHSTTHLAAPVFAKIYCVLNVFNGTVTTSQFFRYNRTFRNTFIEQELKLYRLCERSYVDDVLPFEKDVRTQRPAVLHCEGTAVL
jgi:hypothetical protein